MIQVKSKLAKGLSVFLSFMLIFELLPGGILKASAASTLSITQTGGTGGCTQDADGNISITASGSYTISGGNTSAGVSVASGVSANVTMNGVAIDVSSISGECAFFIASGAQVNLTLSGVNELKSGSGCAGLQVPAGAFVGISGSGSLNATGGGNGAGIGGGYQAAGGSVTISGGTVTATGNDYGAGIGGGAFGDGGTTTITGGTVTATGGGNGAGIGGGTVGNGGTITISGGAVTATGGFNSAGVGGGNTGSGGNITINKGTANATGGYFGAGIGGGFKGAGGSIAISGGTVYATGKYGGADIGGGDIGSAGKVTITGGSVFASFVQGPVTDSNGRTETCVTVGTSMGGSNVTASINGGPTFNATTGLAGELYFWMPTSANTVLKEEGVYYSACYSGSSPVTLTAMPVLDISTGSITVADSSITQGSTNYGVKDCVITQSGSGSTTNTVSVTGGTHNIVLENVDIEVDADDNACPFAIQSGASVELTSAGSNTLVSGNFRAGIEVPLNASLTITGLDTDTLKVRGSGGGAGIGGNAGRRAPGESCGSVTINSGHIVVSSSYGAGIGGGIGTVGGNGGDIHINGGNVSVQNTYEGAGIGGGNGVIIGANSGNGGNGGKVTITGGLITVSSAVGAGIGGGNGGNGYASVTGGNGGNAAKVTVTGGTVKVKTDIPSFNGIGGGPGGNNNGQNGSADDIMITGGSVSSSSMQGEPTSDGTTKLYQATVSIPCGTNVNALAVNQGGKAYSYGWKDMQTEAANYGKLYLWLPSNVSNQETTADVTIDGGRYTGYHGKVDNSNASVLKMDQSLTIGGISDNGCYTYGGVPDVTVSGGAPDIAATVTYSGTDGVNGSTLTNSPTQPTDAGYYTVMVTKTGNDAYNSGTKSAAFTINSKDVTNDASVRVTIPDQTYTGNSLTPSPTSVKDGNTPLTENTDYKVSSYSNNTNAAQKTDANPPTATLTFQGNYKGTKSAVFTIAPKDVTNDADLRISIPDQTYTGNALTPLPTSVKDGNTPLTENTDYKVSSYSNNTNASQKTDANPPTATLTFEGNYKGTKSAVFTINKKGITSSLNVGTQGQTYTASDSVPLSVTISGAANQPAGTVTFTCDGQPFVSSSNVPIQTVSGSYMATVNWTATAGTHDFKAVYNPATSGENYTCPDAENDHYTVGKKTQAPLSFNNTADYTVNNGVIYKDFNDGVFTLNIKGGSGSGGLSFTAKDADGNLSDVVSVDGNGRVTLLKAGTAAITVIKAADATYNDSTATVSITVDPASQSGFAITGGSGYTIDHGTIAKIFGDSAFTLQTTGGNGTGTVSYISTGNAVSVDQNGKVTIRTAGVSTVTATKAAQGNYASASSSVTINVLKAGTSVQTPPAASDIAVIGKLSASVLSGGKANIPGTFVWTNPDMVITKSGSYEATFMPSDSTDYNSCNCMVDVTVTPILTNSQSQVSLDLSGVALPAGVTSVSLGSAAQGSDNEPYSVVAKLIGQDKTLGGLSGLTVYDLKLLDQNGNPITSFTGKIKVKIPIPSGMNGNLKVFWYNPADGTLTDMNAAQENGYLTFETSHFSYYAIAQLKSSTNTGGSSGTVPNPKTGSGSSPIIPFALLGAGSAAGLAVTRRRAKYRVKK